MAIGSFDHLTQDHWVILFQYYQICLLTRSKLINFFPCSDCKSIIFFMLWPSLMNKNEFSLEVTNTKMIARILFSACWNIVWCIKTNLRFEYCMQWLQEYNFLHVGTFCDASKRIFFWNIDFQKFFAALQPYKSSCPR